METCVNCERTIGNLETPCVFNDRIVCPECFERLGRQNSPPPQSVDAKPVFNAQGVIVTNFVIVGQGYRIQLSQVLSVKAETDLFGGKVVDVRDVVETKYRFKFTTENAKQFIAALASVKGNINVERDPGWFIWW